jgi:hypothetical protein
MVAILRCDYPVPGLPEGQDCANFVEKVGSLAGGAHGAVLE